LLSDGRDTTRPHERAFAVTFVTVNVAFLLVAGAFSSLPYGYDRLHDRYLFYVVPLWLIVFVVWLADGLPRPIVALATGVGLALVLPAILPFRQLANEAGVDTVPGALWVWLEAETAGPGPLSARALLAALIGAPEDAAFAGGLDRSWIDDRVAPDASVAKLFVESSRCGTSRTTRHSLFLTEFFNDTVHRAAYIGDSVPDGIPSERVDLDSGALVLESGGPFVADYVFTQPGIELNGEEVARGSSADLVLWRIGGAVRVTNALTNEDVRTIDCA
jgi:hypothetical protein